MLTKKHIAIIVFAEYRENLSILKKQSAALFSVMQMIDSAFFWHPNHSLLMEKTGVESVRASKYHVPIEFKIHEAFVDCMDALNGKGGETASKHIFFLTDSFEPNWTRRMRFVLNHWKKINLNYTFSVIGFGNNYDRSSLEDLCIGFPDGMCECNHFDSKDDMLEYMKQIYKEM